MHFLIIHTCTVLGEAILLSAVDILLKHWKWKGMVETATGGLCSLASAGPVGPRYLFLTFLMVVLSPCVRSPWMSRGNA